MARHSARQPNSPKSVHPRDATDCRHFRRLGPSERRTRADRARPYPSFTYALVAFMEMTKAILEPGVTPAEFASVYPRLYHMAHEGAWPQIQRHGLLNTRSILDLWEVESVLRSRIETQIRRGPFELSHPRHGKVVIRDQKPMNEKKLRTALIDCTPQDW